MYDKPSHPDDLEELSRLIDELNAGRKPECDNPDIAELLEIAQLIKDTGDPIRPPQHILDQTVNSALAGIEACKPKKSPSWWFSGALGTAAAVILVFGLNMLTSWQKNVPTAPPPVVVSQQKEAATEKPVTEKQPAAPQAAPADQPPVTKQQPTITDQPKTNPTVEQVSPNKSPKPPMATREKAIIAEEAPRTSQSKSAYISEAAISPASALTPLKLPGKTPDLVVTDRENGVIRQVYYKGTLQEITITQRLQPKDADNTQAKSQPNLASKALNSLPEALSSPPPEPLNTVQVSIGGQEVTLEGRQSRQELLKLAESLIP